jgi:broad specificity phosphatase PhoE
MITTVHLVRHAQVRNPENTSYGRMPGFHLSEEGKKRAKKAGEFFKGRKIPIIYTSPLERAFETANIISDAFKKPLKVVHKYELIEVDAKKWQSFPVDELFQNKYFESFINDPDSVEVPENLANLANRIEKFTKKLCGIHEGQEIICVTHEFLILALRLKLEGKSLIQLRNVNARTGSITTLEFDESCHLKDVKYTELD